MASEMGAVELATLFCLALMLVAIVGLAVNLRNWPK